MSGGVFTCPEMTEVAEDLSALNMIFSLMLGCFKWFIYGRRELDLTLDVSLSNCLRQILQRVKRSTFCATPCNIPLSGDANWTSDATRHGSMPFSTAIKANVPQACLSYTSPIECYLLMF